MLSNIDFHINAAECIALFGQNGAGKSSLLRLLAGVARPSAGTLRWSAAPYPCFEQAARNRISFLPHEPPLHPRLSVFEQLRGDALLKGEQRKVVDRAVGQVLQQFQLQPLANKLCGRLSRGNAQRVALASCWLGKPELLLLDEPTTGLDPAQQSHLAVLLRAHCARGGSVLLSSHSLAQVQPWCDRLFLLEQGRLAVDVTPAQLSEKGYSSSSLPPLGKAEEH